MKHQKIVVLLLAVAVSFMPLVSSATIYARTEAPVHIHVTEKVEAQNAALIRLILSALAVFGKKVADDAWRIAKPKIDDAMENLERYDIIGPNGSDRIVAIIDKKSKKKDKRIFGLDYHRIRENGKRSKEDVLPYHVEPNRETHHIIWPKNPTWQ